MYNQRVTWTVSQFLRCLGLRPPRTPPTQPRGKKKFCGGEGDLPLLSYIQENVKKSLNLIYSANRALEAAQINIREINGVNGD